MFAIEPTIVRLPANVVASASTFHIKVGSMKRAIQFPATSTNGTLEKTFDPATENRRGSMPAQLRSIRTSVAALNKSYLAVLYRLDHLPRRRALRKKAANANQPASAHRMCRVARAPSQVPHRPSLSRQGADPPGNPQRSNEFDANQREQTAIYRSEVITSVAIISTAPNNGQRDDLKAEP
jgi:hypothetical protein